MLFSSEGPLLPRLCRLKCYATARGENPTTAVIVPSRRPIYINKFLFFGDFDLFSLQSRIGRLDIAWSEGSWSPTRLISASR